MQNSKLDLIAVQRQHFISRLQWVEPEISSPPGNAALLKSAPFLGDMRSLLGKDNASCGAGGNPSILNRSKLSTGERK